MPQRLNILKSWKAFVLLIAGVPLVAYGIVRFAEERYGRLPYFAPNNERAGNAENAPVLGKFSFRDADDKPTGSEDWKGRITIAHFFFTSCPTICPQMMSNMKTIQSGAGDVRLVSVTVDPAHDTPENLRAYIRQTGFGEGNWQLLTGDKRELYRFARKGLYVTATDGDGGPEDFIHSDRLVLLDKYQRIRGYYSGISGKEVQLLLDDLKKLQHER
ncbi:SCO family protein [Chitinophaga rhizosphaerae]|uniref:SCO family protein n=1 Tax=Chitinophaga rhizosphaerae TaxID=1864947 RepID=UPI000F80949C|nr:SCO family protein [Chitinophaga rhizosphaerae]